MAPNTFNITKEELDDIQNTKYRNMLSVYSKLNSTRATGLQLNYPHQTVAWVVKKYKENPKSLNNENRGRPKAVSKRSGRIILKDVTNKPNLTLKEIKTTNNFGFSESTISRFLNTNDVRSAIPPKQIVLTQEQKNKRLDFAKKYICTDFAKVFFSDEKRFCLDGPDHYKKVWMKKDNDDTLINRSREGNRGIMIHLVIGYQRPVCMNEMLGNYNSDDFIDMVDEKIYPLISAEILHENYRFQQDNCPIHKSSKTQRYFIRKGIKTIDWPSRSPDLNIIENVFGILSGIMYRGGKIYRSQNELWAALENAYANLPMVQIQHLYHSMPNRLIEVIQKGGGLTKY